MVGPLPRTAVLVNLSSQLMFISPTLPQRNFLFDFHLQVGAGSTPPGVDLDRVAASISSGSLASLATAPSTGPPNQAAPPTTASSRQFGGRIAVAISGAAQNLKSR